MLRPREKSDFSVHTHQARPRGRGHAAPAETMNSERVI